MKEYRFVFAPQTIPDIILVAPKRHGDARGFFVESYRQNSYSEAGIAGPFVQDNYAYSKTANVMRGLHFQIAPAPQAKLVTCLQGRILDVAVDIRQGSPTFGHHVSVELSGATGQQLYVPAGFAHGYLTLTPDCHVQYKVSHYYDGPAERALAWNDPGLGIDWPIAEDAVILSDKDKIAPNLQTLPEYFTYSRPPKNA